MIYRKIQTALTGFVLIAAFQACTPNADKKEVKAAPVAAAPEFVELKKTTLSSSLQIPGELVAFQQVDLYAKVNSFIKRLTVDIGSEVSAGQVLAVMEAPELASQLSGARARLKAQEAGYLASKATYQRLLSTSKTPGTVSPNDLDLALAKQNADLAQLESAKAAYAEIGDTQNYLTIRAPFSGVITARNVSAGAYVGPSGKGSELPVFTLQQQNKLRLAVSVPEVYAGELRHAGAISFTVKAFPGETFHANISRLSGALDARLRSQRTEMDVTNTDKRLLPGMIAEVAIPVSGKASFVVPLKAVLRATTGVFVLLAENNTVKWIPVQTGRQTEEAIEVFGELKEGGKIIKVASEEIRDGSAL